MLTILYRFTRGDFYFDIAFEKGPEADNGFEHARRKEHSKWEIRNAKAQV